MKIYSTFVTGVALTALAATSFAQRAPQRSLQLTPDSVVAESLTEALTGPSGEYAAYATYQAVILKFGKVQPFVSIMDSEAKHIAALQSQMQKYGVTVPANSWLGTITAPATVTDAALLGVAAEKSNAVMYDQLLLKVKAYPDLVLVFGNLEGESLDKHLPAFEAAAAGNYTDATCTTCSMTGIGVRTNQFGFTIKGTSGQVMAVEASTSLSDPIWSSVGTVTLTGDSAYFSDPTWKNYPRRFYRLRSQ